MKTEQITDKIVFENTAVAKQLFGNLNGNLGKIGEICGVTVNSRGTDLLISGPAKAVEEAKGLASRLYRLIAEGHTLTPEDFEAGAENKLKDVLDGMRSINVKGRKISPKSIRQREYIEAMRDNTIVFGAGPAGCGKTYLAVAMALSYLLEGKVRRIVITRPMIEAGENLGFLPGDLEQKSDPFLRPFFDAIYEITGTVVAARMVERKTIEIAPLAYMRGRTLGGAFVILDEAQNTTSAQMKMFLTRIGFHSKAVITGDMTQTDLPGGKVSGLREAEELFADIEGMEFMKFSSADVVRSPLVKKIVDIYEKKESSSGRSFPNS